MAPLESVQVIFFDFMGTCLDWHTNIVNSLPHRISERTRSSLAIAWRESFFKDIHDRFEQKLPPEDIDVTHARLLKRLLSDREFSHLMMTTEDEESAVRGWHQMTPWPDVPVALDRLKSKYEVFVLANGTTRLQLDLTRSSGLSFDMLFSSQLLGLMKPDPEIYKKAMSLVSVKPEDALMVAAHAYDLQAARTVGMRTVYIRRWTEDTTEDMEQVSKGVNLFLGGTKQAVKGEMLQDGLLTNLADLLC